MPAPRPFRHRTSRPALDFDALYRDARDDVFAYVATLLRDRAAAEDVTAQAFERAYRRRARFDARRGHAARVAVRHRPQRRARRAAPAQAHAALAAEPADAAPAPAEDDAELAAAAAPPSAPRWPRCRRASAS